MTSRTIRLSASLVVALLVSNCVVDCADFSHGWGDDIAWVSLEKGREISATENKPLMVIIHKTWCGACKSLKAAVAKDEAIAKFSSNLVMVNLEDDEEPNDASFAPDGGYVPRVFFLPAGSQKVDTSIYNIAGNQDYKYFYYDAGHLLAAMKKAVESAAAKTEL